MRYACNWTVCTSCKCNWTVRIKCAGCPGAFRRVNGCFFIMKTNIRSIVFFFLKFCYSFDLLVTELRVASQSSDVVNHYDKSV